MAAKWPDVRDSYLPNLFENLRSADLAVQVCLPPRAHNNLSLSSPDTDGSSLAYLLLSSVSSTLARPHHGRRPSTPCARPRPRTDWSCEIVPGSHKQRNKRNAPSPTAPSRLYSPRHPDTLFGQRAAKHHEASRPCSCNWSADCRRPQRRHTIRLRLMGRDCLVSQAGDCSCASRRMAVFLITGPTAIYSAPCHSQHRSGNEDVPRALQTIGRLAFDTEFR